MEKTVKKVETLEAIVKRIIFENQSTLLTESAKLQAADLANTSLELHAQMHNCLPQLPVLAFEPEPGRQPGEAGWTAGGIVSTNNDRLPWAIKLNGHK